MSLDLGISITTSAIALLIAGGYAALAIHIARSFAATAGGSTHANQPQDRS